MKRGARVLLVGGALVLVCALLIDRLEAQPVPPNGQCEVLPRAKCPGADLHGELLKMRIMAMMDLSGANLSGADLQKSDLWKTDLAGADLSGANLAGAFLTGAKLSGANLRGADLRGAFLLGAFAEGANFEGALLDGARWVSGAICGPTSIGNCRPLAATAAINVPMPPWQHLKAKFIPPTGPVKLVNNTTVTLFLTLPADPEKAGPTDGSSFTGLSYVPSGDDATLNINVKVPVSAEQDNVAVIAVFADEGRTPVKLFSKPLIPNRRTVLDFSFQMTADRPLSLQFRIGPAQPGGVTFNAPTETGSNPDPATVTITEDERTGMGEDSH